MPTVIGINQVPGGTPRPRFWDYLGQLQGTQTRQVTDALLAALTAGMYKGGFGQVPTTPTVQNPGTFNFPPGSQSPGEAAQIQQMGGVPTRGQPFLSRATQQPGTGGVSYTQPTQRVNLNTLANQLAIQKAQADLDPNSAENQLKRSQAEYWKTLSGMAGGPSPSPSPSPSPQPPAPSPTSPVLQQLWTKAQSGDAKSMDALRLLALEKDDPEAIALLQQLGEL